jgi:Rrf2 family transcriptional regulator, nitric oxide-sensitive transcriptional repressor
VLKDHPLRAIQMRIDKALKDLDKRFAGSYAALGRPSICARAAGARAVAVSSVYVRRSLKYSSMQLTYYTDYSFRVLMYLAVNRGRIVNISEIAGRYGISRNHLVKVVHNLARGGFIKSYRGKGGGIELARDPAKINIGEVVRYTEGPLKPVECFDVERNRCIITNVCGLAQVITEACNNFFATLDRYSLADLLQRRSRLAKILSAPSGLN